MSAQYYDYLPCQLVTIRMAYNEDPSFKYKLDSYLKYTRRVNPEIHKELS